MSDLAEIADLTQRLPTREEIDNAAEAATVLANARDESGSLVIKGGHGDTVRLAPALGELVIELLSHIARGDMVTLVPRGSMLTTQEAADILNVSRPFLSKLLKEGKIPFVQVGSHRRVKFVDLKSYKEKRDSEREAGLRELAELGQEFDAS